MICSSQHPRWTWKLPAMLLACLAVVHCGSYRLHPVTLFEEKTVFIRLVHETGPGGLLIKKGFKHPMQVAPEDMAQVLAGLRYSDPVFLWKEKDRPIFSDSEVARLSAEIARAMGRANSDQMIEFWVKTWKKDMVFGSDKITSGYFFVNDEGMNWVFGNVNYNFGEDGVDQNTEDPRHSPIKGIRIALRDDQKHFRPQNPRWFESKLYPNWLVGSWNVGTPLAEPIAANPQEPAAEARNQPAAETRPSPTPTATPKPAKTSESKKQPTPTPRSEVTPAEPPATSDASERLRRLKGLRDEGLISAKDYEQKKSEILKDL